MNHDSDTASVVSDESFIEMKGFVPSFRNSSVLHESAFKSALTVGQFELLTI
jgi:hypothetical protein